MSAEELLADECNAAELANGDEPELESLPVFLQSSIVIRGWAHVLSASPKAGKTTLLAHIARDWLDQGLRIIWLTEEPKSVWRRRLHRLGGDWSCLRGRSRRRDLRHEPRHRRNRRGHWWCRLQGLAFAAMVCARGGLAICVDLRHRAPDVMAFLRARAIPIHSPDRHGTCNPV
jgi:hypothetical protein